MKSRVGGFELLVLLALIALRGEGYGWSVQITLSYAGHPVGPSAIYRTLRHLELKLLVRSRFGKPLSRPGGRRKRHYEVTPAGRQILERSLTVLSRLLPRGMVLKRARLRERVQLPGQE